MKKGLSVLLIAAALFGFYGGATNLNDVLACKDYWEETGAKSTADMNKLEDGLNQLKDNEEAYLAGLDAVAEGEQTLADGEAQYAKGLADYAAAPGKLAAARKQIADGEAALEDGQDSIDGLTKLINGIKTIRNGYNKTWKPGYDQLKSGRNQLYEGSNGSIDDLTALAAFLDSGAEAYVSAVNDVAGDDEKQTAKDYKTFIKSTNEIAKDLPKIQKNVEDMTKLAKAMHTGMNAASNNFEFAKFVSENKSNLKMFTPLIAQKSKDLAAQYEAGIDKVAAGYENFDQLVNANMDTGWTQFFASDQGKSAIAQAKAGIAQANGVSETAISDDTAKGYIKNNNAQAQAGVKAAVEDTVKKGYDSNDELNAGKPTLIGAVGQVVSTLEPINEKVNGADSAIKNTLLPGLKTFNSAATEDKVDQLSDGQNTIAGGVATVASAVLGNSTLKSGVQKKFGSDAIKLLKNYSSASGPLSTKLSDFAAFEAQMDSKPGVEAFLEKAQKLLQKTKADGLKTLAAGKKKLASGKAQYAQGLKNYEEAPGKLADAEQQLADGRKQLAEGKEQLAVYEDGEQQVRDGLATLMGTEANGGLTSILDRRNGDADFDNGDNHLELDEGLDAVAVGRGYQGESGELITKEITSRAVGTAAGLGAAALAVLAAVLSFLKKNKGAGVSAILAAVAGAAGVAIGSGAGSEFSSIAGSTVGATPWVAAGILAAVAAVHAIAHFAAKKEA